RPEERYDAARIAHQLEHRRLEAGHGKPCVRSRRQRRRAVRRGVQPIRHTELPRRERREDLDEEQSGCDASGTGWRREGHHELNEFGDSETGKLGDWGLSPVLISQSPSLLISQ